MKHNSTLSTTDALLEQEWRQKQMPFWVSSVECLSVYYPINEVGLPIFEIWLLSQLTQNPINMFDFQGL